MSRYFWTLESLSPGWTTPQVSTTSSTCVIWAECSRCVGTCSLMCGCGMVQTWDPLLSPFFSAPPAIWPLFVDENPWDALCGYSTLGGQYWKCVRVSFRSFPKVTECHHHWMHCSTPSNGNKCPWQLVDRNDGNEKVNYVSHGSKQLSILVPWGMSSDNTNNLSTGRPSVVLYFMSTSHNKRTQILTTRTILGPWVLGVLAPYQPSQTSASTPIFARELWNALWTWQTRRPSWWVFGSMNAAQLHEASLQCDDVPTVPTCPNNSQKSQVGTGSTRWNPQTGSYYLWAPDNIGHPKRGCRYIAILSLLIPPKSTHYPRMGGKNAGKPIVSWTKHQSLHNPVGHVEWSQSRLKASASLPTSCAETWTRIWWSRLEGKREGWGGWF